MIEEEIELLEVGPFQTAVALTSSIRIDQFLKVAIESAIIFEVIHGLIV